MSRILLSRGSRARLLGFAVVLIAAIFGSVVAAHATASEPATITGYVRNTDGVGIADCLVYVSGETSVATPWDPWNTSFAQEATTDATGKYVITDIIQGTYSMYVNNASELSHLPQYSEAWPWHDEWIDSSTMRLVSGGTTVTQDVVLPKTGVLKGRAMDGAVPISGAGVDAVVVTEGVQFERWTSTDGAGRYNINDATPGDWSVAISAKDREIPMDALPSSHSWDNGAITEFDYDPVTVDSSATVDQGDTMFALGQKVRVDATEEASESTFWLPDVSVTMTEATNPDVYAYNFRTGDDGYAEVYLPAGNYHATLSDDFWGAYLDKSLPDTITLTSSPSLSFTIAKLTGAPGTYRVHGKVTESGSGDNIASWIDAAKVIPGSSYTESFRRVPSNGSGNSLYSIRLPQSTGYTGHQMKLTFSDQAAPPNIPYVHVTGTQTVAGPGDTLLNKALSVGGDISGTIRDEAGDPVPGCMVSVTRKAFSPDFGGMAWVGADSWYTLTDIDGNYTIGGLPANSDFKVNVVADYNPGWLLPQKYQDYYRRTYQGQPLVDSLNSSASPIGGIVDHTPVSVALGGHTTGIDETITPGGYIALHADGPHYPTGAVWCDVMYQYKTKWFEIDSGYTTGGLFQKVWKVMPTGNYRVEYNDYFGRGGGTWYFTLGAGEHKYASVLVPAPVTFMSSLSGFGGAFAGLIGGGLPGGGAGGAMLTLATTATPSGALPSGIIPIPGLAIPTTIPDVFSTGTNASGIWTLTLPYSPSVADGDVPYLRVIHYKKDGTTEVLAPIGWNTIKHTIMVQTSSLSPFRIAYKKHTVKLGTPVASASWKRYTKHTVYGSLSPFHKSGVKSARIMVYRRNSHGHYVWYKNFSAPNYTYRGHTRYRGKFSLKAGKYRFYAYAYADKWHLATKTKTYKSVTVK